MDWIRLPLVRATVDFTSVCARFLPCSEKMFVSEF